VIGWLTDISNLVTPHTVATGSTLLSGNPLWEVDCDGMISKRYLETPLMHSVTAAGPIPFNERSDVSVLAGSRRRIGSIAAVGSARLTRFGDHTLPAPYPNSNF